MFRVTHNGMSIKFCNDMHEVNKLINEVLSSNAKLSPKLVYNYRLDNAIFICYRYYTLYCEMFLVEED